MNRRDIREAALCMIFDYSFHTESDGNEQLELYLDNFQDKDKKNISDELRQAVTAYFNSLTDSYLGAKDFSNARFVRNLFERTCSKAATRRRFSGESEFRLLPEDFDKAIAEAEFSDLKARRTGRIGF